MEHVFKDIAFYVQKHPLVRDKLLGAPVFVKLVYCRFDHVLRASVELKLIAEVHLNMAYASYWPFQIHVFL